jgi:hypothetical protein
MSTSNGSSPDLIRETLQPLVDHRETLGEELVAIEQQATDKKEEVKRIDRLLREGGLIDKPKSKTTKASRAAWVSEEMLDHAREGMSEVEQPFSVRDLQIVMEVSEATVRKTIDVLRDRRELRLLGNRSGRNGHMAAHYEVVA